MSPVRLRPAPVAAVLSVLLLNPPSLAAEGHEGAALDELPMIHVHATAIHEDAQKIASPFSVLEGDALATRTAGTLGETLNGLPGVHADTFGGGASRPVIRGQAAPRVTVLSDSAGLLDASDLSPDHAVTAEPMLVRRIEVLRGPATLLYGSGAIGGVVNLLDEKVPTVMPEAGISGGAALRGGTAARERAIAAGMTTRAAPGLALRLEGTARRSDDYRARGIEEARIPGTWTDAASATVGASWIHAEGFLGLAWTLRDDDYGVPGHDHEFESCHPHDDELHCDGHEGGDDHDHDHDEGGAPPAIALRSGRFDLRGEWQAPVPLVERIRLRASRTDYRHDEREHGQTTTRFDNEGMDARLEVHHAPLAGWRGVAGVQHARTRSSASGEEALLPTVKSRSTGLFLVEHLGISETLHLEMGLRQEWQRYRPVNDARNRAPFRGSATSFSAAAVWQPTDQHTLSLTAGRYERLPHAQELYARGVHLATNTYECGLLPGTCGGDEHARLRQEASRNIELGWRGGTGRMDFALTAYRNDVDDYTHARTLDAVEDFRLVRYAQRDARFHGAEIETTWQFTPMLSATLFGDFVRARFAGGGHLPRIPAARYGGRVEAQRGEFTLQLELLRVGSQQRIADFETRTPGHELLGLTLRQRLTGSGLSWYLRGSNLLDQRIRNHSSFVADSVPLPGRNLAFGVNLSF